MPQHYVKLVYSITVTTFGIKGPSQHVIDAKCPKIQAVTILSALELVQYMCLYMSSVQSLLRESVTKLRHSPVIICKAE